MFEVGNHVEIVSGAYSITKRGSKGVIKSLQKERYTPSANVEFYELTCECPPKNNTWDIAVKNLKLLYPINSPWDIA